MISLDIETLKLNEMWLFRNFNISGILKLWNFGTYELSLGNFVIMNFVLKIFYLGIFVTKNSDIKNIKDFHQEK